MTTDLVRVAPEVARYLDALPAICERHHVLWLDLFGSAVNGDFGVYREVPPSLVSVTKSVVVMRSTRSA